MQLFTVTDWRYIPYWCSCFSPLLGLYLHQQRHSWRPPGTTILVPRQETCFRPFRVSSNDPITPTEFWMYFPTVIFKTKPPNRQSADPLTVLPTRIHTTVLKQADTYGIWRNPRLELQEQLLHTVSDMRIEGVLLPIMVLHHPTNVQWPLSHWW